MNGNRREGDLMTAIRESEFQRGFFHGLVHDYYEFQDNNIDSLRFGRLKELKYKMLLLTKRSRFIQRLRRRFGIERTAERLIYILRNIDRLESFCHLLGDDYSKQLLIALSKFKVLGAQHVRLPLNNEKYWEIRASIDRNFLQESHAVRTGNWHLNLYKLKGLDGPLHLHAHPLGILNTFLLEQYAYQKVRRVTVQPGDVVIDGGSCWGDTALYFADRAGAQGRVFCFEFVQDNLEILKQNLSLNQHLAGRIEVVPKALWDKSGEAVSYWPRGPSTWLGSKTKHGKILEVSTMSIDDFVEEEGIARVDFIKMDIEGSELRALQGAEETIRTFKPKLAISTYHKEDDFIVIPDYLDKLDLGYEFFLDHFSIHFEETVLFASPRAG